jgi:thiamine biosynthesis lipoprotein
MNGHDFFTRQLSGYAFLTACNDPAPWRKPTHPRDGARRQNDGHLLARQRDESIKRQEELRGKIQAQLDADDQLLSTYKNDSALMRFNLSTSTSLWPVSEAMADIVTESMRVGIKPTARWM